MRKTYAGDAVDVSFDPGATSTDSEASETVIGRVTRPRATQRGHTSRVRNAARNGTVSPQCGQLMYPIGVDRRSIGWNVVGDGGRRSMSTLSISPRRERDISHFVALGSRGSGRPESACLRRALEHRRRRVDRARDSQEHPAATHRNAVGA